MKPISIVHITDIHSETERIGTAIHLAPPNSLVAVSGDIHDWDGLATPDRIDERQKQLRDYGKAAAKKGCHLAVCSGNHDDWATPPERGPYWLDVHEDYLHGDFTNEILALDGGSVLLTCIPWRDYESPLSTCPDRMDETERKRWAKDLHAHEEIEQLLSAASKQRHEKGIPWVWLHHNPPSFTAVSGLFEASSAAKNWIMKFQPTAVLCGHTHTSPFVEGGDCQDYLGETLVSNPGSVPDKLRINSISIEGKGGAWTASSELRVLQAPPLRPPKEASDSLPLVVGGIPLISEDDACEEWILRLRKKKSNNRHGK